MQITLEQQMLHIGSENSFHAISVGFNRDCSAGAYWSANVHWKGFSRSGIPCASGSGKTAQEALDKAVVDAAAQRAPYSDRSEKAAQVERLREQLAALTGELA